MKHTNRLTIARFATALLLGATLGAHADDTEIYLQSGNAFKAPPIAMFYLENSSNMAAVPQGAGCTGIDKSSLTTVLNSTVTPTDAELASVTTALKTALVATCPTYDNLKEYLVYPDSAGATLENNDFFDGKIDTFELVRAATKRVLITQGDLKVGVILAHKQENSCVGPSCTGKSNGAYILQGANEALRSMTDKEKADGTIEHGTLYDAGLTETSFDPTNGAHVAAILAHDAVKKALFTKLNSIPAPQGGFSHPYQDKEVYFEMFRYLTGKPVFNGHNGWTDFGTSATYNLGHWDRGLSNGKYNCRADSFCEDASQNQVPFGEYQIASTSGNSGNYNGEYNGDFAIVPGPPAGTRYFSTQDLKWDTAAESDNVYISPITEHCQRIFAVNIVNSKGSDNDSNSYISQTFANDGMQMAVPNTDQGFVDMVANLHDYDLANGNDADPVKRVNPLLDKADKQNVTSFFLARTATQLDAAAGAGGTGKATELNASDPEKLVAQLDTVLNQILSVSTTFVAASIPVNVFNRSEVIDNAYIALFQADGTGKPAWMGDVKKLKLDIYIQTNADGSKTNKLQFVDALGTEAIAPDGRIDSHALTFWTNKDGYDITYNATEVTGNDPPVVDDRDGRAVTRGGAGQKIPTFLNGNVRGTASWTNGATGARQLFTENNGALLPIEYSNLSTLWPYLVGQEGDTSASWPLLTDPVTGANTYVLFGDYSVEAALDWDPTNDCNSYTSAGAQSHKNSGCRVGDIAASLIAYMRGYDLTSNAELSRLWIMGDPLHSRPLPINYGMRPGYSTSNPDIRILVGSNDGYLRMIKNTSSGTSATATELGQEVWAFMPAEVMKIQKQLMDNSNVASTLPSHPYGVDGSPVAYVKDEEGTIGYCTNATSGALEACSSDLAMVYFGLRRGGRAYYALDITNPDAAPVFKWKKTNATSGFSELGLTFSQPVLRYMNWGKGEKWPVLIFAGGYDTNKDLNSLGTDDTMGRAIYIIDASGGATSGELIWKVAYGATEGYDSATKTYSHPSMVDSIPSEVTAVPNPATGLVDRIYVGDTGGRLWRLDLPGQTADLDSTSPDIRDNWKATVLMNMGRHSVGTPTQADDRRFFNAPDVVPTVDADGHDYDAIVIGSGNREHPLGTTTHDWLYMYKDYCITQTLAQCHPSGFTAITPADLFDVTGNCLQMDNCGTFDADMTADLGRGWKLQLTASGEKSLAAPLTLQGTIYVSTYVPTTTYVPVQDDPTTPDIHEDQMTCKPEGKGYFYALNLADAGAVFPDFSSSGDADTPVTEDRKRELASGGIPAENVYVSFRKGDLTYTGVLPSDLDATGDLGTMQWRSFWYEKQR